MAEVYLLVMWFGVPLSVFVIAMLAGLVGRDGDPGLDWEPVRSSKREAELELTEIDQMLAAQNRSRNLRGAPARSLAEVSEVAGASVEL